jgi:hypothetical protein
MEDRELALVWFLRVYAGVLLLALPAALAPEGFLAAGYQATGLGNWPEIPLLSYLTRSASAIYALIGTMLLVISFDVARYRPLILLLGWASIFRGVYLIVLEWAVGLPLWWVLVEGPGVLLSGIGMLVLARGSPNRS